jgi:hypothetical protein
MQYALKMDIQATTCPPSWLNPSEKENAINHFKFPIPTEWQVIHN